MKTKQKKILKSDIIGQQGIALIHQAISGMGFLWHPTGLEAGIDGLIELRDEQTDVVSGHFVAVQSKAADQSRRFTAETGAGTDLGFGSAFDHGNGSAQVPCSQRVDKNF
jgi:hypothetical protein